ncbi:hypothetical protein [Pseudomonas sp.]|uniref:hypothetical protein n=1 Tax=Pseudomonas sp. TaxID=306 RepID=UPI003A97B839
MKFPSSPPPHIIENAHKRLAQEMGRTARWLTTENLSELRHFLETLENFITQEERKEIEALEPHATSEGFWEYYYPYQWQQIIGDQLRKSFIVSLMSSAEFHLNLLCRDVAIIAKASITHEDLKGSTIARARKFLDAFSGFTAPKEALWELISDIYTLRNSIVHNSAIIDTNDRNSKRITALMGRAPGLSNPSAGVLEIRPDFCHHALSSVEDFFAQLHEQFVIFCQQHIENG